MSALIYTAPTDAALVVAPLDTRQSHALETLLNRIREDDPQTDPQLFIKDIVVSAIYNALNGYTPARLLQTVKMTGQQMIDTLDRLTPDAADATLHTTEITFLHTDGREGIGLYAYTGDNPDNAVFLASTVANPLKEVRP